MTRLRQWGEIFSDLTLQHYGNQNNIFQKKLIHKAKFTQETDFKKWTS